MVTLSTEFIFLKYPKSFPDTLRHLDNFISFCSIYKLLKDQSHVVWFDAEGIPPPPTSFVRSQQGIFYRALIHPNSIFLGFSIDPLQERSCDDGVRKHAGQPRLFYRLHVYQAFERGWHRNQQSPVPRDRRERCRWQSSLVMQILRHRDQGMERLLAGHLPAPTSIVLWSRHGRRSALRHGWRDCEWRNIIRPPIHKDKRK